MSKSGRETLHEEGPVGQREQTHCNSIQRQNCRMDGKLRPSVSMDIEPYVRRKPLRSWKVEALRAIFFTGFAGIPFAFIAKSLATGRTIFPVRYNRTYVSISEHPIWYLLSLAAWVAMFWLMGWVMVLGWKRAALARRLEREKK